MRGFALKATEDLNVQLDRSHHKRDIAERKMDEEVHGFAADNVPGIPHERSPLAPGYNGNRDVWPEPKPKKKSLHQKHHRHSKRDIAERKMDEEVHGFSADNVPGIPYDR